MGADLLWSWIHPTPKRHNVMWCDWTTCTTPLKVHTSATLIHSARQIWGDLLLISLHLSSSPFYYFLSALNDLLSNNCKHHSDVFHCFVCLACQVKNQYYHTFESWHLLNMSPSSHIEWKYKTTILFQVLLLHVYISGLDIYSAITVCRNCPCRGQTLSIHFARPTLCAEAVKRLSLRKKKKKNLSSSHAKQIFGVAESPDSMISAVPPEQSPKRSSVQLPGEQKWAPPEWVYAPLQEVHIQPQ